MGVEHSKTTMSGCSFFTSFKKSGYEYCSSAIASIKLTSMPFDLRYDAAYPMIKGKCGPLCGFDIVHGHLEPALTPNLSPEYLHK
ncbi:hypothetical protein ES703_125012 [subsurface metagenome]